MTDETRSSRLQSERRSPSAAQSANSQLLQPCNTLACGKVAVAGAVAVAAAVVVVVAVAVAVAVVVAVVVVKKNDEVRSTGTPKNRANAL